MYGMYGMYGMYCMDEWIDIDNKTNNEDRIELSHVESSRIESYHAPYYTPHIIKYHHSSGIWSVFVIFITVV